MRRIMLVLSAGAIAGCVPALPRVEVPRDVFSDRWDDRAPPPSAVPVDADFWSRFGSPMLPRLVADGLDANASLDAVRARVDQARSEVRAANAALLPTIGANAGLTQTRTDNRGASEFAYSAGSAGLDVAYEVDLFGRNRAGKRAARARAKAAVFDAIAARLVVETEIARTYVALGGIADRQALTDRLLANARELLRIVAIRQREGVASEVDRGLQQIEVRKLEAQHAQIEQSRRTIMGALAVLMGREAPRFGLPVESLDRLAAPAIDPGQPGDLVFRRPDILAAEARIAAAGGEVQQARAAFLPSLKLSGNALGQALSLSGPLGLTLTAAQSLLAPIFSGGRLRADFERASAVQRESVALYRQSLLEALQEGNAALAAVNGASERERTLALATREGRRAIVLARRQYTDGAVDLTTVLDAERNEIQIEDALIQARQDRLTAAIDTYKALGGAPVMSRTR